MRYCVYLLLVIALPACTVVKINSSEDVINVERGVGITNINTGENTSFIVYDVVGVGYVSTPMGYSLGYTKQTIALGSSECRVVVWVSKELTEQEIEKLKQIDSLCITPTK